MMNYNKWVKNHLWLFVLIAIAIGLLIPKLGVPFKPYIKYLLMLMMFFGLLEVSMRKVAKELKNYKREFIVLLIVHLLSPLIIWVFKSSFSKEIFLGLILASSMASGVSAIFLSHLYHGKPAEALVITSTSTLASPFIVPLVVLLFAGSIIQIDGWKIMLTMIQLVILPFILAVIVRKLKWDKPCKKFGDSISILLLFVIILGVIAPLQHLVVGNIKQSLFVGFVVFVLIAINAGLGWMIGRDKKEKITFALNASYKNFVLAIVVALSVFSPVVALPAAMYAIFNNIFLIPFQWVVKKK